MPKCAMCKKNISAWNSNTKDDNDFYCKKCWDKFIKAKPKKFKKPEKSEIIDKKIDLNKELKTTGIILIVFGAIQLILSSVFSYIWAIVAITIGIIALCYRSKKMLLVLGIALILVGLWNIFWTVFVIINPSSWWRFSFVWFFCLF